MFLSTELDILSSGQQQLGGYQQLTLMNQNEARDTQEIQYQNQISRTCTLRSTIRCISILGIFQLNTSRYPESELRPTSDTGLSAAIHHPGS